MPAYRNRGKGTSALAGLITLLAAMVLAACGHTAPASPWSISCSGTANHHDGDTFWCDSKEEGRFIVRVASVDAPETVQAYWRVAHARLRELAAPGSFVDCYKVDRYERRVCRLKTKDGLDAADLMLSEGLAWYPEDFANEDAPVDRERYRRLVAEAQVARRGLWGSQTRCRQRPAENAGRLD